MKEIWVVSYKAAKSWLDDCESKVFGYLLLPAALLVYVCLVIWLISYTNWLERQREFHDKVLHRKDKDERNSG